MSGGRQLLDAAIREVEAAEEELQSLKRAANAFAKRAGAELPYPDVDASTSNRAGALNVRPDQFVGQSAPAAAARAFLELRGAQRGAAGIDDIFDALRRGGYSFEQRTDAEAKAALKVALAKDTNVHRIDNGAYGVSYGLLSWYPGVTRERREPQAQSEAPPLRRRPVARRPGEVGGPADTSVPSIGEGTNAPGEEP